MPINVKLTSLTLLASIFAASRMGIVGPTSFARDRRTPICAGHMASVKKNNDPRRRMTGGHFSTKKNDPPAEEKLVIFKEK